MNDPDSDFVPEPASNPEPEAERERRRRERSVRYPGVSLEEAIAFVRFLDDHGLNGTTSETIAASMGLQNIKTRRFSASLSAARQFGLLELRDSIYELTPLGKAILHPADPAELEDRRLEAFRSPPLYADLLIRFANRRVPDADRLANLLFHNYKITATAKRSAAEAFLASARFAGVLDDGGTLRPEGRTSEPCDEDHQSSAPPPASEAASSAASRTQRPAAARRAGTASERANEPVRIDLRLWGADEGKRIRLRAPESITSESLERLIQAIRLHVRIEDPPASDPGG